MSLRTQVAANGLDHETAAAIFVEEMRAYRNELVHLDAAWKASPVYSTLSNTDDDFAIYQCLWQGIASDGLGVPRDWSFVERHFGRFSETMKVRICSLLRDHPELPDTVREAAMARLGDQGLEANAFNTPVAADLVLQARAAAAQAVRKGNHLIDAASLAQVVLKKVMPAPAPLKTSPPSPSPAIIAAPQPIQIAEPVPTRSTPTKRLHEKLTDEQAAFAAMTPTEFVAVFVAERYGGLEHRAGTKRPKKIVGEPTIRDLHWAALLLEKTIPAGLPLGKEVTGLVAVEPKPPSGMAAIDIDVGHAGIPRHVPVSSDFTRVTDTETRRIILAADRCIVETAVRLDPEAGWDRVALETPQRVAGLDGHKACQRAVRLSQDQARIGSLGVDPCNPVGLAFPGPFAIGTALGNPQDFVGIDFMIAKGEALGNLGRTGTAIAWHYAAAARTAASGFLGFWHFVFPLHKKMPQRPDWTCGKEAS